ncbi:MAG: YraN family protein [Candidatus Moraniibacteriota bacterium]|nr:MAG: YraN family protein [Candidatus Moranbacteria bacterium]
MLETNYRNPTGKQLGEIDIVAQKEGVIIFVEVKTRQGDAKNTFPEDNLTPAKLGKLERIATHFLQSKNLRDAPYHFDAVTVLFDANHKASFQHFEHLFF